MRPESVNWPSVVMGRNRLRTTSSLSRLRSLRAARLSLVEQPIFDDAAAPGGAVRLGYSCVRQSAALFKPRERRGLKVCSGSPDPNKQESHHERSEVERLPLQPVPGLELQVRLSEFQVDESLRLRSAMPMRRRMRLRESLAI